MRRLRAALLILLLLALAVYSCVLVAQTTRQLSAQLTEFDRLVSEENYSTAQRTATELLHFFDRRECVLSLFMRRDQLSGLRISLTGLEKYSNESAAVDLHMELARTQAQVKGLRHLFFSIF